MLASSFCLSAIYKASNLLQYYSYNSWRGVCLQRKLLHSEPLLAGALHRSPLGDTHRAGVAQCQPELYHPAGNLHQPQCLGVHQRRIPLVGHDLLHERQPAQPSAADQKLKWREVFGFRGLWGHLTDKNNPRIDPDGYYWFSTRIRFHAFLGERITLKLRPEKSWHRSISFFYELSTCDLYLINAIGNSVLRPRDYLSLSFGLKLQFL